MKTLPKISVIIPIYNSADYLKQCLDSIVNQTLRDIEIICVNNGSTDNSLKILQKYAKDDCRISIINTAPSNAGTARNRGLEIASGEYLYFIDSDDYCELNALETAYNLAKSNSSDIVVFSFRFYDNNTKKLSQETYGLDPRVPNSTFSPLKYKQDLFGFFSNNVWNKIFRRDFINDKEIRFQEIPRANDVFFTNIALASADRITTIQAPLINYRINNKSSLQNNNNKSPVAFWDAFKLLKNTLIARGLFSYFENTLLQEVLNNSIYTLNSLRKDSQAYWYLYNTIRYGGEIEFSITKQPIHNYNDIYYQTYLEIINRKSEKQLIKQAINETTNQIISSKTYRIGSIITKIPKCILKHFKH